MPQQIKRLISVFGVFIILFIILIYFLKPDSFGELGHYRANAIQENTLKDLYYAGSDSCTTCHQEIHSDKALGFHEKLQCEVCHGPGLKHVRYADLFKNTSLPDSLKLNKPGERKDCALCHQLNASRIKIQFDTINTTMVHQVNVMEHNLLDKNTHLEFKCIECHNPHQP